MKRLLIVILAINIASISHGAELKQHKHKTTKPHHTNKLHISMK